MSAPRDNDISEHEEKADKEIKELPPSGTTLHKRRRGEPAVILTVKSPQTPSDAEGSSPRTAGFTPDDTWYEPDATDPVTLCENMLERLKEKTDPLSKQGKEIALKTRDTLQAVDQLEKLLKLLDQIVTLKEQNSKVIKRLTDVEHLKKLHEARKQIIQENEKLKAEQKELQMLNELLDNENDIDFSQTILEIVMSGGRIKRTGSKWRTHSRFGGSLLRKQRSRSAGGEDSDVTPSTPLRRRSEAISCKEVDKSRVSKWTKVKAAFRWEKAQWPTTVTMGGAAGAVAAGALASAVALAGSAPSSANLTGPEVPRDSASLTPGSAISLSPNSSCEELRMDGNCRKSVSCRYEMNDSAYLHAPHQDDYSTSPSPNKLYKSPWVKMKDIIHPKRESMKKKRFSKASPEVMQIRRRSLSDGGDSDAPPTLTVTIPSSEELESDSHPILRKQRSLELSARPLQQRPPRASKWSKVKKAFLTSASASVPSSPNRHSAFFTDAETEGLSSGCEASIVREEIARNYAVLQSKLGREFSDRRGKLYAASRPVATEEQLSADFRKKYQEWQRIKGVKQPPPVPKRQDLSEDFLKKWDEWTRMKETNSVPAWEEETKPHQVSVRTSTGLFTYQGISRSFTRKLHEWEKSRGIAPEASTSALLKAAKERNSSKPPSVPLTRAQSDGSVAPSLAGSGRLHASSLSVNDADNLNLEFERDHQYTDADDTCDGDDSRGAVLVEIEAEEVCTAALLMAVSPRHTPQKPVYTYGNAEARLLCETSSAVTGTAVLQPNGTSIRDGKKRDMQISKNKTRDQNKNSEKSNSKRKFGRQPSIEEDAKFIRETIKEIERASSSRFKEDETKAKDETDTENYSRIPQMESKEDFSEVYRNQEIEGSNMKDDKRKEEKANGKKKAKSRARLERELSKPSESDTEMDADTVTVEIPRRRKRPRKLSEKPRTPPTSLHSDSEGEVFILKLKAPEPREGSPEVIVRTTRKIFSPVMRSGETVPSAVIPVDVEDLVEAKSVNDDKPQQKSNGARKKVENKKQKKQESDFRSKSSGDLQECEEQKRRNRPPLPLSPSSQRKPQPKETAPSIRIMIQKYNKKINEDGHTSGASSGASSPAWRSPSAERRRPPDMPVGVNIRNNPFLEKEVQKSASACQLSRRDQTCTEKPNPEPSNIDGVLKSYSANALHPQKEKQKLATEGSQETISCVPITASTDTIVPDLTRNLPIFNCSLPKSDTQSTPNFHRQISKMSTPEIKSEAQSFFDRSASVVEHSVSKTGVEVSSSRLSERTAKIHAARERFLFSSTPIRREGTNSASDLRPGDRSSRISCESDVTEAQSNRSSNEESGIGRSASTGNVDGTSWERTGDSNRRSGRSSRSRFSLARLAAKLRKKDEGAVSRLCRKSLVLVQLRNNQ